MIIPARILKQHTNSVPYISALKSRVRDVLMNYCEERGYAFISRVKSIDSLAEKIETGRYQRWSDLDDQFACTIIIPTLLDENDVIKFLESVFVPVNIKKRGSSLKPPDAFRFDATRFIGKLIPLAYVTSPEPIYDILFEVQVRSAFEHAWSVATHALTYKGNIIDWRLLRLTAQLKAAVEQLDSLILGFEESAKYIGEQEWPEVEAKKAISDYFKDKVDSALIPDELSPKDWSRFSDNFYNLIRSSPWSRGKKLEVAVKQALEEIDTVFGGMSIAMMPRSVSLLQLVIGILTSASIVIPPLYKYHALITPELELLYPSVKSLSANFQYDE